MDFNLAGPLLALLLLAPLVAVAAAELASPPLVAAVAASGVPSAAAFFFACMAADFSACCAVNAAAFFAADLAEIFPPFMAASSSSSSSSLSSSSSSSESPESESESEPGTFDFASGGFQPGARPAAALSFACSSRFCRMIASRSRSLRACSVSPARYLRRCSSLARSEASTSLCFLFIPASGLASTCTEFISFTLIIFSVGLIARLGFTAGAPVSNPSPPAGAAGAAGATSPLAPPPLLAARAAAASARDIR
mmetsp:Transcript_26532/g.44351  ORF Transcript_26532/g.44351 Transcript_26532/m.44351 type:complete len:253 (-) Transcript_26532:324-1082(-)